MNVHGYVWSRRWAGDDYTWCVRMTINGRNGFYDYNCASWHEAMAVLNEEFAALRDQCGDDGATVTRRHWQKNPGHKFIRRCTAITQRGTQCTNDGVGDNEPALCIIHSRMNKKNKKEYKQ